ncbi:glycosyltransferase family 2 protein [Sphingomonas fuzhouensis]|uniref:glycosyltransferase family 2 protein n=1 Tax=Sphingomonas fuzhouensis TaxID=3106033 RepID=UPI002AFE1672|nr:glycosyltransferase family 2 protein [Sphingomonas sp. SGZ-02]
MALIDIILPVRNGEAFIAAAIDSLRMQTERDWRLLVLNHASTDRTGEIVDQAAARDSRIVQIPCDAALSLSDVRNLGLDRSDAPLIALHDADDISLPDRLAQQRAFLEANPALALVGGQYEIVDSTATRSFGVRRLPHTADRLAIASLFNNPIAQPTVMLRRSVLEGLGARYDHGFLQAPGIVAPQVGTLAEDYWLFAQLAMKGLCANLPHTLIRYRRHEMSIGVSKFQAQMAISEEISDHLMRLLAAWHDEAWQTIRPFCNHGAQLAPVEAPETLPRAWRTLRAQLLRIFGDTPGVRRELAFRDVLANRTLPILLARFARFQMTHQADTDEMATLRHILSQQKKRLLG